jgi:hypothetical protein
MTHWVLLLAFVLLEEREEAVEDYLAPDGSSIFEAINPSDPTQFDRGVQLGAEWVDLAGSEGDLILFHLGASQPLGARSEFRVAFDLPLGGSDTATASSSFGLADLRLNLAWRPFEAGNEQSVFAAWSLEVDLTFPTGSASKSLGAGDWVVAPAAVFKWRTRTMSFYLTTRWLYADGVNVAGIRGFNIPGTDAFYNSSVRTDLNAPDVEFSFAWEFDRKNSPVHWFAITPDWTSNFAGDKNNVLILKTRLGRAIADTWYFDMDFWVPIAGERTQDFTLRFAFIWEF